MVIKMSERSKSPMARKEVIGNRKEIRIGKNEAHLRIVGNDNRVLVKFNSGFVDVVGNSSKIKVLRNDGDIHYTGNSGRISLGSDSTNTHVHYTGTDGRLKLVNEEELLMSSKKKSPQSRNVSHEAKSEQKQTNQEKLFPETTNVKINNNSGNIVINNIIIS